MNAQEIVAANVAARGYRDGWTAEQFVARQLCKLQEETGEAVGCLTTSKYWAGHSEDAGESAAKAFRDRDAWLAPMVDFSKLRSELADVLVVLFAAAQALDFDVVQAAIDKSSADVARGVR
ncbi:MAG: hypothetical protein IPK44_01265 [Candidatus Accumulibacter sp.]|uniref:hypothetical protein n=1 Tax=Accumulibacter sp. TaxID=2053492 RepID=UPI0025876988|nr:hypothetical protein [Accumulibacter sp.]MBK8113228.1 hypothetical protein [Accumulibacter sp.]